MIDVIIENRKYHLKKEDLLGQGTEGAVFSLNKNDCYKHIDEEKLHKNRKLDKIITLVGKYDEFTKIKVFEHVTCPMSFGYTPSSNEEIVGYTMQKVQGGSSLTTFFYNSFDKCYPHSNFSDVMALSLTKSLFEILYGLHSQGIIIGDLQPENIILNQSFKPYIIDFDSVQFGEFSCSTAGYTEYICPSILNLGKNHDGTYPFSKSSDIYSLASICFALIIGVPYYDVAVKPVLNDISILKSSGLNYFSFKDIDATVQNYEVGDKEGFMRVQQRMNDLRTLSPKTMEYLESVLNQNKREYLSQIQNATQPPSPKRSIKIHPVRGYNTSSVREDPEAFKLFIQRFNLTLPL